MSNGALAFFIGLFGSLHCIGMCGPLAFAVPSGYSNRWLVLADKLVYQLGRIVSYTILGLVVGIIGKQLWLSGLQQGLSILSGALIVLAACSRLFKNKVIKGGSPMMFGLFNKAFKYALESKANHLLIGILNGFLPCGFVYLAMAGAVNTGDIAGSAGYMFWFGLGTVPLMLVATFSMGVAAPAFRTKINKVMPYLMLCLGVWFIMRGLTLNIPYLSPSEMTGTIICK